MSDSFYQSYQSGIEMDRIAVMQKACESINRTKVELKWRSSIIDSVLFNSINRTKVELKF